MYSFIQLVRRFTRARQTKPTKDARQNMANARVTHENGMLRLSFEREIDTGDSKDWKLSDSHYFLFPVGGGLHSNTDFSQHRYTPVISEQKIGIGKLQSNFSAESNGLAMRSFY